MGGTVPRIGGGEGGNVGRSVVTPGKTVDLLRLDVSMVTLEIVTLLMYEFLAKLRDEINYVCTERTNPSG